MGFLTDSQIQELWDKVIQDITEHISSVQLYKQEHALLGETYTVQTTFEGGYNATLFLCADTALFTRLAQCVLQSETVSQQDVEDFAKEYFNIICGQIVAKIFQTAHVSSRFSIPDVCTGRNIPHDDGKIRFVLNYTSSCNDGIQLIHQNLSLEKSTV